MVAILNTQNCSFQSYKTIAVQGWIDNAGSNWNDGMIEVSRIISETNRTYLIVTRDIERWS